MILKTGIKKVLLEDLDAGIVSICELSKTKMLIAFDDGEIHCYDHNLYEAEGLVNPKMDRTCRIKFNDLSDYAINLFKKGNSVYVLTSRGTLFLLGFE